MSETTIYALAITTGLICQIILQVMAKMDAIKAARMQQIAIANAMAASKQQTNAAAATVNKINAIAAVTRDVHTLVNSNMGVQLKLNAELSRWKATQMKGSPGEAAAATAANEAEKLYNDHVAKQHIVDNPIT